MDHPPDEDDEENIAPQEVEENGGSLPAGAAQEELEEEYEDIMDEILSELNWNTFLLLIFIL